MVEHALHLVRARFGDLELAADVAQRNVQHGAVLGRVDVLAREHVVPRLLEPGLTRELHQRREHRLVDEVLAQVDEQRDVLAPVLVRA